MWCLVTSRGQRLPIRSFPAVLGRQSPADLLLPHASIAPAHARFTLTPEGEPFIVALGDALVEVDGWRLEETTLHHGDKLLLGTVPLDLVKLDHGQSAPADNVAKEPKRPTGQGQPQLQQRKQPRPAARPRTPDRRPATAIRTQAGAPRPGFLNADLSQLGTAQKLLIIAGLAAVGAVIVWGLSTVVPLLL